jgi:hypothetical protein
MRLRLSASEDASPAPQPARREPSRTSALIARAAAHDRISSALRNARERTGLEETEVVDLLHARGVPISRATLQRWERTGGIRLEDAVDLAAVYGMTLDELVAQRGGTWPSRFLGSVERTRVGP